MKLLGFSVLLLVVAVQGKSLVKHGETHNNHQLPFIRTGDDLLEFERQMKVNMNDYVDKMLEKARAFMIEHGLDPAQLPDIEKGFSATDLIGITWHGELVLDKGWAQDLSTIYRSGDVLMDYANKTMRITANMGFTDLTFSYDFSAKIMNIGPTGNIDGRANQVQIMFKAIVDLSAKTIALEDFQIAKVGDVQVKLSGMGTVIDWIADAIVKIVIDLFKGPIMEKVEGIVRSAVEDALANIDIGDFLPPHY